MRKNTILIGLGLLLVLIFAGNAAGFYRFSFVERLSAIIYDYRLQFSMPGTVDSRVVILDIDEKSLEQEGHWPWSRDRLALLLDKLFEQQQVAVVGFDVVFAEQDDSSGLKVLQGLQQQQLKDNVAFNQVMSKIAPDLQFDQRFADSIKDRKVVLGYYLTQSAEHRKGMLPDPVWPSDALPVMPSGVVNWAGYGANLAELQQVALSAGHFNPQVDADGVVRRVPILAYHNGAYYESLSLAVVRALLDQAALFPGHIEDADGGYSSLESLVLDTPDGQLSIPVDASLASLVPYRGPQGSFNYISAADVLSDRLPVASLKDKVVLVGTTSLGLMDMRATPVSQVYPGVEIHANMIAGILEQSLRSQPAYMLGAEVLWLLLLGGLLSYWLPRLSARYAIAISGAAALATVLATMLAWHYGQVLFPVANFLIVLLLLFAINMSYGYLFESRTKRQITGLFGQYVPAELVDEMSRHPETVSMKGESREMTVLFSDVRGFTSISEGLEPQELSLMMNEFLTPLSRVIHRHRGTIDKYMGDCIMAFWGAPLRDPEHARHAILAGLEMLAELERLQPHFKQRGWPEIHIGVGINTGRMNVGNMGSEVRVAYTVMGDAVNLASRLEGITKQYGVGIIVGESTRQSVPDFVYRELDLVRVKGKDRPVAIYEPLGLVGEVAEAKLAELALFHQVRVLYREQAWERARQILEQLQVGSDQALYRIYAARVAYFVKNPPGADWDGVYVFHEK